MVALIGLYTLIEVLEALNGCCCMLSVPLLPSVRYKLRQVRSKELQPRVLVVVFPASVGGIGNSKKRPRLIRESYAKLVTFFRLSIVADPHARR